MPVEPTEPTLPTEQVAASAPIEPGEGPEPPARAPSHRKRNWLIALGATLVVLVAAFFVGDAVLRQVATAYVKERVATALSLSSSDGVKVDLGSGSLIVQALGGRLDNARVDIPSLALGSFQGSATLVAHGIPLDSRRAVDSLVVTVAVPEANLSSLAGGAGKGATITLSGESILLGMTTQLFGATVPIEVAISPKARDGKLEFSLTSLSVNGISVDTEKLNQATGGIFSGLGAPTSICVASELPASLTLTRVAVEGKRLVFEATGENATLAGLDTKGTCASG